MEKNGACRDQDSNLGYHGHNVGSWPLDDHGQSQLTRKGLSLSNTRFVAPRGSWEPKFDKYN